MATRDYQFIVGPETSTLPTATEPTQSEDIMTKGYADTHYVSAGADPFYAATVGSSSQVTSGFATHSTIASAISAVSAPCQIKVLPGTTFTETVSINKAVVLVGAGYSSYINGTVTFTSAADNGGLKNMRVSGVITCNSGATKNNI